MAINYNPVGWDSTKFFNPTNMNHMDEGIKAACDRVDAMGAYEKYVPRLNQPDVLSDSIESGIYYANQATNLPVGVESSSGYLEIAKYTTGYERVLFTPRASSIMYINTCYDGNWSGWQKLVTSNNLGSNIRYRVINTTTQNDGNAQISSISESVPLSVYIYCPAEISTIGLINVTNEGVIYVRAVRYSDLSVIANTQISVGYFYLEPSAVNN